MFLTAKLPSEGHKFLPMTRTERAAQTETRPFALRGCLRPEDEKKVYSMPTGRKLPLRKKMPFMGQEKRGDRRGNPPSEGNQNNFLNHLLHRKGRKAVLKLDAVK